MTDRRVHARLGEAELVRYDRAGKWFKEYTPPRMRPAEPLRMADVTATAREWQREGGEIFFGVPGGAAFDRKVRRR